MIRWTWRSFGAAMLVGGMSISGCGGAPAVDHGLPATPHPVIVLAIDGLRADSLGCYGAPSATPAFDAIAAEAIRFEAAYAQAPTAGASLATLLSGLYPTTNGLREPGDRLQPEAETLAESLNAHGFKTAAFVEGSPGGSDFGLAQGFDSYQVVTAPGSAGIEWMQGSSKENFFLLMSGWGAASLAELDRLLEGMPSIEDRRIVEVFSSRGSGDPQLFDANELASATSWYQARVQLIDAFLELLFAEMRSVGLADRATLIILGTNGFALQEHADLFGETLYAPVTHVPVLIRLPGGTHSGSVAKVVEVIDLMPTILELVGVDPPVAVQGGSLVPVITGGGTPPYIAFSESPAGGGMRRVVLGGFSMISGAAGEDAELYDLAADPLEANNIAGAEQDRVGVMRRHLEAWEKMVAASSLDPNLRVDEPLDEDTLKQLKSLGYIQ